MYNIDRRLQAFDRVLRAVPAQANVPTMPTRLIKHTEIVFFINCSFRTAKLREDDFRWADLVQGPERERRSARL